MPDKVKLAVFNSLGDRVVEARVLDLFAGIGGLGLECLSRGAAELVSVEKSERHARYYQQNLKAAGLDGSRVQRLVADVFHILPRLVDSGRQFDLVIADPPYGEKTAGERSGSLAQRLLDSAHLPKLLAPHGLLVLGHAKRDAISVPAPWHERRALKHGDTVVLMLELPVAEP